ncbi:MAG: acyl-CoA dehydrogenase family protein [Myxococcota bacterium]
MANFLRDNDDLRFYLDGGLDWETLVELTERGFHDPEGFDSMEEAKAFYEDVLDMVGGFLADEVAPHAAEIDREGVSLEDGEVRFPPRLQGVFDQIKELDLHRLCLPRELGGMNAPLMVYFIVAEMFARADVSAMTHFGFHGGMAMAMLIYSIHEGTTEFDPETGRITSTRFQEAIEEIARGEAWGAMDITEPDAGSDMAALRARGEQDADGHWTVTGEKIFITSGHAKYHFVVARTEAVDPDDPFSGLKALSLFLVPTYEEDAQGNRVRLAPIDRIEEKLGHHGSATCTVSFDETPAWLIGERGEGFKLMLLLMNNARVGVSFEAIGLSEAALRLAREYAVERRSMGKTIDRHEMIADWLDEMDTDIRGLRALAMTAGWSEEVARRSETFLQGAEKLGRPVDADLKRRVKRHSKRSRRLTPLAKYLAAERAVEIARRGLQIHGGAGYMTEYGAEKLLRDALVMPIYEGTSQIQALMVMKDTMTGLMKRPQDFVRRLAEARWRSVSSRDPLDRSLARLRFNSLKLQQHLMTKTVTDKVKGVARQPVKQWPDALKADGWNPKRDFAYAMLHAERLTRVLADVAIAEILWEQAERFPERRPILERWLERAEPRGRYLLDVVTSTGERLVEGLREEEEHGAPEVA